MTTGAVQTIWAELLVGTLADAGVTTCVISPGSRSTPLVSALAADGRFALPTIVDERAAAFYALGVARATGATVALVCTSGSAAAHYYPALVEASQADVPLVAITSDRPPELQHCGASQTIDQVGMYGSFVRAAFDVGAPVGGEHALRALRRTVVQAIAAARRPRPWTRSSAPPASSCSPPCWRILPGGPAAPRCSFSTAALRNWTRPCWRRWHAGSARPRRRGTGCCVPTRASSS